MTAEYTKAGKPDYIPYLVFDSEMARQERQIKRMWIAMIVLIVALALTVGAFVWYLWQYDYVGYEQDGEGVNIIGDLNGDDYYVAAGASSGEEESFVREGQSNPETP